LDGKRSRVGDKLRVTTSTPDNRDEARAQMSFAETEGIDPYDKNIQVAAARGLPKSWGEIAAGHLVIAQASLEYGWWEAVVLARNGDTFTLQYRDYPPSPSSSDMSAGLVRTSRGGGEGYRHHLLKIRATFSRRYNLRGEYPTTRERQLAAGRSTHEIMRPHNCCGGLTSRGSTVDRPNSAT
jgi:hypothetical protein